MTQEDSKSVNKVYFPCLTARVLSCLNETSFWGGRWCAYRAWWQKIRQWCAADPIGGKAKRPARPSREIENADRRRGKLYIFHGIREVCKRNCKKSLITSGSCRVWVLARCQHRLESKTHLYVGYGKSNAEIHACEDARDEEEWIQQLAGGMTSFASSAEQDEERG